MTTPTYHDVVVTVNGTDYPIVKAPYRLMLTCTRAAGWELWEGQSNINSRRLIGGEYNNDDFKITVAGMVICERNK